MLKRSVTSDWPQPNMNMNMNCSEEYHLTLLWNKMWLKQQGAYSYAYTLPGNYSVSLSKYSSVYHSIYFSAFTVFT